MKGDQCLQEEELAYQEHGFQDKNELYLDTKGTCFLCLKEPSSGGTSDSSDEGEITKVCFQDIYRHLGFKPCSVLLKKGLKGSWISDGEQQDNKSLSSEKNTDFSVMLCNTCSSVTKNILELISQLDYQLQIFHQILSESEEGSQESEDGDGDTLWKKLQEKLDGSGGCNPLEVVLAEHLRQETKEKCSVFLKNTSVRPSPEDMESINLEKTKPCETYLHQHPLATTETSLDCEGPYGESEDVDTIDIKPTFILSSDVDFHSPEEPLLLSNPPNTVQQTVRNDSSKDTVPIPDVFECNYVRLEEEKYGCNLCNYVTSSGAKAQSKICRHLVNEHPESLFPASKCPKISEPLFRNCCEQLFLDETEVAKKQGQKVQKHGSVQKEYSCKLCERNFAKGRDFRCHLVREHYDMLEQKLIQSQRNVQTETSKKDFRSSTVSGSSNGKGSQSTQSTVTAPREDLHRPNENGSGKINIREGSSPKKSTWICALASGGCGGRFAHAKDLVRHKKLSCPELNPSTKKTWTCNADSTGNGGCGKPFSRFEFLYKHRLHFCPSRMNRKIWICQTEDGGCGQIFTNIFGLEKHKKEVCPNLKCQNRKLFKCVESDGGCGRNFTTGYQLRQHQMKSCPNKVKKDIWICKVEDVGCGCGHEFKTQSRLILHQKAYSAKSNSEKVTYTCDAKAGGCGGSFSSSYSLQRHQAGRCPNKTHCQPSEDQNTETKEQ